MTAAPAKKLSVAFVLVALAMAILYARWFGSKSLAPTNAELSTPITSSPLAESSSAPDLRASPPEGPKTPFSTCSTVLSQQVELAQLAAAHHLELTSKQLVLFAAITRSAQSDRRRYEANIAVLLPGLNHHIKVIIPSYSLIGDKLRARYFRQLTQDLGSEKTSEIRVTLGADLENLFADFGASEQGLDVLRQTGPAGLEYVVNTVSVFQWDSAEQAYAVHRETHLLPTEDPTGSDWGGFVRLFAEHSET